MNKKVLLLFILMITVALPGTNVMAEPMFMRDVNTACNTGLPVGETKITAECSVCHDLNDFDQYDPNQDLYESHGACEFCPENADCAPVRPTNEELLADARDTTNQYFEKLFAKFMEHMQLAGGDFAAVFPDCSEIAPLIAGDFSRETGYLVRRVTNRTRNARNTPDGWEVKQLEEFEKLAENGRPRTTFIINKPDNTPENPSTLTTNEFEATAFVNEEDVEYFRYMRSITLPGLDKLPCLKCHGTFGDLADGVREAIGVEYPYDVALGYKAGDIRGAWTIKIPIIEGED